MTHAVYSAHYPPCHPDAALSCRATRAGFVTSEPNGKPTFTRARTAAGLLLVSLVCFLFVLDYASTEFEFGSIQLGLLLGTALLFLGVEAGRKYFGGG